MPMIPGVCVIEQPFDLGWIGLEFYLHSDPGVADRLVCRPFVDPYRVEQDLLVARDSVLENGGRWTTEAHLILARTLKVGPEDLKHFGDELYGMSVVTEPQVPVYTPASLVDVSWPSLLEDAVMDECFRDIWGLPANRKTMESLEARLDYALGRVGLRPESIRVEWRISSADDYHVIGGEPMRHIPQHLLEVTIGRGDVTTPLMHWKRWSFTL